MPCAPMRGVTSRKLQVHAVVEHPLTGLTRGRISLRAIGKEPILYAWSSSSGHQVMTDETGSEAYGLLEGRYSVRIQDAEEETASFHFEIASVVKGNALCVTGYNTKAASSSVARDGSVEAKGYGPDQWSKFLWTNGVETTAPLLRDVPIGTYAIMALPLGAQVPEFVHACAPAKLGVR